MPKSASTAPASTALFRIVAVMVLFLSITTGGLQVLAAINVVDHPDPNNPVLIPTLFIPPILSLIVGIALSSILEGIARLVGTQPSEPADHTAAQVNLMMTIAELQNSLPTLIAEAVQRSIAQVQIPMEASSAGEAGNASVQQHLERLVKLMEEMKELSMLDETQRQTRRKQTLLRRKNSRLEEAAGLIEQSNWSQADALLHLMESLHPGDADVLALRNRLDDVRVIHQSSEWTDLEGRVSDLLALSQYAQAIEAIDLFMEQYPAHPQGQSLSQRIREEQRISIESASNRLYDGIKTSVEARQWRAALDGIQQFLESYPDHSRAEKIRKQVRVIQKNAEIEERHEQEDRIKELIAARQYAEAADLSEDLLERFPGSPQATYLAELLPKLREKSTVEAEGAVTQ